MLTVSTRPVGSSESTRAPRLKPTSSFKPMSPSQTSPPSPPTTIRCNTVLSRIFHTLARTSSSKICEYRPPVSFSVVTHPFSGSRHLLFKITILIDVFTILKYLIQNRYYHLELFSPIFPGEFRLFRFASSVKWIKTNPYVPFSLFCSMLCWSLHQ